MEEAKTLGFPSLARSHSILCRVRQHWVPCVFIILVGRQCAHPKLNVHCWGRDLAKSYFTLEPQSWGTCGTHGVRVCLCVCICIYVSELTHTSAPICVSAYIIKTSKIQNSVLIDMLKMLHLPIWNETGLRPPPSFGWQDKGLEYCTVFL